MIFFFVTKRYYNENYLHLNHVDMSPSLNEPHWERVHILECNLVKN